MIMLPALRSQARLGSCRPSFADLAPAPRCHANPGWHEKQRVLGSTWARRASADGHPGEFWVGVTSAKQ